MSRRQATVWKRFSQFFPFFPLQCLLLPEQIWFIYVPFFLFNVTRLLSHCKKARQVFVFYTNLVKFKDLDKGHTYQTLLKFHSMTTFWAMLCWKVTEISVNLKWPKSTYPTWPLPHTWNCTQLLTSWNSSPSLGLWEITCSWISSCSQTIFSSLRLFLIFSPFVRFPRTLTSVFFLIPLCVISWCYRYFWIDWWPQISIFSQDILYNSKSSIVLVVSLSGYAIGTSNLIFPDWTCPHICPISSTASSSYIPTLC